MQALKVTQHDRLQRENKALLDEAKDVLGKLDNTLDSVTTEDEEHYKMYVSLLRQRRLAIQAWSGPLDQEPDDPANAISAFKDFQADACLPENSAKLPSPEFEHLLSRFEIASEAFDKTEKAAEQDDLKETLKSFGERKALVKNLFSCGLRAVKDLKSARAARQKTFEARVKREAAQAKAAAKAKAKEEARASGGGKPPKGAQAETANAAAEAAVALPPIFQFGTLTDLREAVQHLKAQAVPTVGSAEFSSTAADVTKPFLVESCSELEDALSKDDMVRQRFSFFLRTFQNSPQFGGSGRGTMNLPDISGLLGMILKYAPAKAVDPVRSCLSDKELATLVKLVGAYAFSDAMRYSGTEFKQAATLRFQLKGKRRFAAVGFAALQAKLLEFRDDSATQGVAAKMSELSVSKLQDISVEVASQVLQAATTEDAEGLMPMFYIGESDANSVSYMPPGFFMLDITSGKQMVTGFRASVLVAAPQLDDLKAIIQTFEASGRDAGLMVSMVNAMKNHDVLITMGHAGVKKEEDDRDDRPGGKDNDNGTKPAPKAPLHAVQNQKEETEMQARCMMRNTVCMLCPFVSCSHLIPSLDCEAADEALQQLTADEGKAANASAEDSGFGMP